MPIYEYECGKCGDVFEVKQAMADDPLTKHEGCGGKVTKLISSNSFQLKGGGWYKDGYTGASNKSTDAAPPCASGGCATGGCPSAN